MILTDFLIITMLVLVLGLVATLMLALMGERVKEERKAKIVFWSALGAILLLEAALFYSYFAI